MPCGDGRVLSDNLCGFTIQVKPKSFLTIITSSPRLSTSWQEGRTRSSGFFPVRELESIIFMWLKTQLMFPFSDRLQGPIISVSNNFLQSPNFSQVHLDLSFSLSLCIPPGQCRAGETLPKTTSPLSPVFFGYWTFGRGGKGHCKWALGDSLVLWLLMVTTKRITSHFREQRAASSPLALTLTQRTLAQKRQGPYPSLYPVV